MNELRGLVPHAAALALAPPQIPTDARRPYTLGMMWAYHMMRTSASFGTWLHEYCERQGTMWAELGAGKKVAEWYANTRREAYREISDPISLCTELRDNFSVLSDTHAELLHRAEGGLNSEPATGSSDAQNTDITDTWLRSATASGCTPEEAAAQWLNIFSQCDTNYPELPAATLGARMPWFPDLKMDLQRALFLAHAASCSGHFGPAYSSHAAEYSDPTVKYVMDSSAPGEQANALLNLAGFKRHESLSRASTCDDGTRVDVFYDCAAGLSPANDRETKDRTWFAAPIPSLELAAGQSSRLFISIIPGKGIGQPVTCRMHLGIYTPVRKKRDEIPALALVMFTIDEDGDTFDSLKKKCSDKHSSDEDIWEQRMDLSQRWRFAVIVACTRRKTRNWRTVNEIMEANVEDDMVKAAVSGIKGILGKRTPGRRTGGGTAIIDLQRDFSNDAPPGSAARAAACGTYDVASHRAAGEREPKKRRRELSKGLVDLCSGGGSKGHAVRAEVRASRHIEPLMSSIFRRVKLDATVCEPLIESVVSIVHARNISQAVPAGGSYIFSDSDDPDHDDAP